VNLPSPLLKKAHSSQSNNGWVNKVRWSGQVETLHGWATEHSFTKYIGLAMPPPPPSHAHASSCISVELSERIGFGWQGYEALGIYACLSKWEFGWSFCHFGRKMSDDLGLNCSRKLQYK
jgi:hypothetical protein